MNNDPPEFEVRFGLRSMLQACAVPAMLLAVAAPNGASAQVAIPGYPAQVTAYDVREVGRLPNYCRYTQSFRSSVPGGNDPAQISHWYSVMGETFHAMHHYCWGLMKLNRALYLSRSQQTRSYYFGSAIQEFDYVLERAPESFVLLPEILTKRGQSLIRIGRGPVAIADLERAIQLKPDYWPPYVQLSDYYREIGKSELAREVLEKGLAGSPDSTTLKQRLADLKAPRDKQQKAGN